MLPYLKSQLNNKIILGLARVSKDFHLVVVHHGIHAFDPIRVEIPVEHYPLRCLVGNGSEVSHNCAQHPILPFSCSQGNMAVEFFRGHGLGVDINVLGSGSGSFSICGRRCFDGKQISYIWIHSMKNGERSPPRSHVAHLDVVAGVHTASGFLKHLPAAAFTSTSLAHDEVAVSNCQKFVQLRYLGGKRKVVVNVLAAAVIPM